jgi:hypothetical protein
MVVVDKFTPGIASAFSAAPSSFAVANGGLWGSGGPALDEAGNVYDTTGNSLDGSNDSFGSVGRIFTGMVTWNPTALTRNLHSLELLRNGSRGCRSGRQQPGRDSRPGFNIHQHAESD